MPNPSPDPNPAPEPTVGFSPLMSIGHLITYVGIASYSIEGIGLVFVLRQDFIRERSEKSFMTSYFSIYTFVIALYVIFGLANFAYFGSAIGQNVFYNFTKNQPYFFWLQICYAIVS